MARAFTRLDSLKNSRAMGEALARISAKGRQGGSGRPKCCAVR